MLTGLGGPLVVFGRPGNVLANGGPWAADYDPDQGPSGFDVGSGLLDPTLGYRNGVDSLAGGSVAAYLFMAGGGYCLVDQAPSTAATANIAALANVTSGTAMTLVSSSGAGVTVTTSATTIQETGNVVPSGALALDSVPTWISFGQNGAIAVADPRKALTRAVSITGSTSGTGGAFKVVGYDWRGVLVHETITATAGATTVNGKKTYKFIASITPQFTDAHNYSVGTADIFGFPLRVDEFAFADIVWNNGTITASTGFTAADTTSPATATTGDVRGTYAVQSASDGTKKLQLFVSVAPWNAAPVSPGVFTGLFGVSQFAG